MRVGLTTAIATAIAIGVIVAATGGSTQANLWIDTNGGSCVRSASPIAYAGTGDANSCSGMDTAYVAANTGDLVMFKAGTYGAQTILAADAKGGAGLECDSIAPGSTLNTGSFPVRVTDYSDCITFRSENVGSLTLGALSFEVPYVYLDGGSTPTITVTGSILFGTDDANCSTAHDIVVSGVATSTSFFMKGSHNTLQYSDFNLGDAYLRDVVSQFNGGCPPTSNLVYRNTFRNLLQYQKSDQVGSSGPNQMHIECIHMRVGTDTVFDSNKFLNCAQYGLSAQSDGGSIVRLYVVNNVFDEICSGQQPPGVEISSGTFTSGSNVITAVSSTASVDIGDGVYSIHLPYTNNILSPPTVPLVQSKTANSITLDQNATGSQTSNFTVGGSACTGNTGLQLTGGATYSDPLVAFNSFYNETDAYDQGPGAITNAISYGNIKVARGSFFCANATYSYLVNASDWPASAGSPPDNTCGTGSVTGIADYLDVTTYDFRISGSSAANNLVPSGFSAGVPLVDIKGNARTGSLLDAGAYDSAASAP